jgi:hypothetical protein
MGAQRRHTDRKEGTMNTVLTFHLQCRSILCKHFTNNVLTLYKYYTNTSFVLHSNCTNQRHTNADRRSRPRVQGAPHFWMLPKRCSPNTVCCLLSAVCCLLSAVCCLLSAVCCLLSAVCCLLSVCVLAAVCLTSVYFRSAFCLPSASLCLPSCCPLSALCLNASREILATAAFGRLWAS